jgi:hypothetical protein
MANCKLGIISRCEEEWHVGRTILNEALLPRTALVTPPQILCKRVVLGMLNGISEIQKLYIDPSY